MKIFGPIFEAMVQSRQRQADPVVRDSLYFAQQAREYDLQLAADTVSATKPDTTGSFFMPIKGLAY